MAARDLAPTATAVRCPHCHKRFGDVLDGAARLRVFCRRCRQFVVVVVVAA